MASESEVRAGSWGLRFEQYGPLFLAVLSGLTLLYFSHFVAAKFASGTWKSAGLYTAIFGWSAIQTGFAFGVYGFVVGKGSGFIAALKNTQAMSRFLSYIKRANITGFALTIFSIPLIIAEPNVSVPMSGNYLVVAAWFALFVWSFLSFLRLAYNFGQVASVKDKVVHGA